MNSLRTLAVSSLLATVALAAGPRTRSVDRTRQVLAELGRVIPQVDFEDTRFEEVVLWFRAQGLKNIIVNWQAMGLSGAVSKDTPVTLQVSGLTLGELLDLVIEEASAEAVLPEDRLAYHIDGGIVRIATRAVLSKKMIVRVYAVEDLVFPVVSHGDAPQVGLEAVPNYGNGVCGRGVPGLFNESGRRRNRDRIVDGEGASRRGLDKLVHMLETSIAPESWATNGGAGTITPFQGRLIIHQTLEVHEMIGGVRHAPPGGRSGAGPSP